MIPIRSWLFIGKYRETINLELLNLNLIQSMLLLAEQVKQPGITTLYLPVDDFDPLDPTLLRRGVDFVRAEKAKGHRILVACGAGVNRSSTFAIATLKEEEQLSLQDAWLAVHEKHPQAMPHRFVWESVCEYYQEVVPYSELAPWADV